MRKKLIATIKQNCARLGITHTAELYTIDDAALQRTNDYLVVLIGLSAALVLDTLRRRVA